jgi:hypothetical protein
MREFFEGLKTMRDIDVLISDGQRESETIEYKEARNQFNDPDKNEIAKDVSAMANSSGGTIIYGVATDPIDKTKPAGISGIMTKNIESFSRVVNSRIQPVVRNLDQRVLSSDKFQVLVVYIPQSAYSPHQNLSDKRYYHRSGIESLPMGHDLVELHFGRRLGPLLSLIVEVIDRTRTETATRVALRFLITNNGQRVGRFVEAIVFLPEPPLYVTHAITSGHAVSISNLHQGRATLQFVDNVGAFHRGMNKSVLEISLDVASGLVEPTKFGLPVIQWAIYADQMERQTGFVTLGDLITG